MQYITMSMFYIYWKVLHDRANISEYMRPCALTCMSFRFETSYDGIKALQAN
jgi:hypothetical protein